jgi:hypothetical protein
MCRTMTRRAATIACSAVVILASGCSEIGPNVSTPPTPEPSRQVNEPVNNIGALGDIPDNQAYVAYSATDGSYTVKYPKGWARTEVGSTIMFDDGYDSLSIAAHNGFYRPTESYIRSVELGEIASSTAGFEGGAVETVQRPAGSVIKIAYQGDFATSSVAAGSMRRAVERYEYSRGGRGVVLTLAGPLGSDTSRAWRTVTDSFTWLR